MILRYWVAFVRWTLRNTDYIVTTGESIDAMQQVSAWYAEQRMAAAFSAARPDEGKRRLWLN